MDDLLGEDWQKPAQPNKNPIPSSASAFASSYSSFRASPQLPQSGTSSPLTLSRPNSTVNGTTKPAGSSDAFGGLLNPKTQKAGASLSIQERQKQLLEEKRRQQEQQSQIWETLGSGRGTPEVRQPSPAVQDDEDDFLAAFSKDAPVNRASHFAPPPSSGRPSGTNTPALAQQYRSTNSASGGLNDDDDDPFGLNSIPKRSNGQASAPMSAQFGDDDDILGDLGKPVQDKPPPARHQSSQSPALRDNDAHTKPAEQQGEGVPEDQALAELIDMGFPADNAKLALAENGGDVQNAVGWLLQQAHQESKQKMREQSQSQSRGTPGSRSPQRRQVPDRGETPAWLKAERRPDSATRRQDNAASASGDKDATQVAQEIGSKLFKSANSFWKAGQKQVAKTIADLQQDSIADPSQPKWMRDASVDSDRPSSQTRRQPESQAAAKQRPVDLTDEAALLDAPRERPQKPPRPVAPSQPMDLPARGRGPAEALPQRPVEQPKFMQQPDKRPSTKLSRQDVEDQSAQAYVSPARRKRTPAKPDPQPEPEVDLFSSAPPKASPAPVATTVPAKPSPAPAVSRPSPTPARPPAPARNIPNVSPTALSTSASHRKAGGEHFKRGDYGAAHESYTAALTQLPPTHPIVIIVLSNRSLTALKTGDAKVAVADADKALELIGPGLGAGESIELGGGEGTKDMKEFYGKALMRKAEALEHMEKYTDAAAAYQLAVSAGVGGAVSLRGRDRCEKAAAPKAAAAPASTPKPASARAKPPPPAKSLGNSLHRPTLPAASSSSAVSALRKAHADAEKADDEKFALSDSVDAKLNAWKGGKSDNLRALLQSMDIVLWPAAGWKKVGMSDLVVANKVKIIYMKAIGKVHPDKVSCAISTSEKSMRVDC